MGDRAVYKLTFIDGRDQRQFRFIEAYSAKQAEVILKKMEGWHIRLDNVTEINDAQKEVLV